MYPVHDAFCGNAYITTCFLDRWEAQMGLERKKKKNIFKIHCALCLLHQDWTRVHGIPSLSCDPSLNGGSAFLLTPDTIRSTERCFGCA